MHCLELAKTAWNASVKDSDTTQNDDLLASARTFIKMAMDSLSLVGEEGDFSDSPLREIEVLEDLLR